MSSLPRSFLLIMFTVITCGGGGGIPYPPGVPLNKMNLQRVPLESLEAGGISKTLRFPGYEEWIALRKANCEKYGHTHAGIYHAGGIVFFEFKKRSYTLLDKGKTLYIHQGDTVIRKIRLPRYMIRAEVLPIVLGGKDYLVIYVDQQATSNTSTLLVLDENFDIQYQEHLLGALALGCGSSDRYGNYFLVEAGYGPDMKKSLQELNVKWLYYLK